MSTNTYFTVCPHCGYKSEDDAMCQACGVLFDDSPDGNVSVFESLLEEMSGCIRNFLEQPENHRTLTKLSGKVTDIGEEATINPLLGSSWFVHFHDYENE